MRWGELWGHCYLNFSCFLPDPTNPTGLPKPPGEEKKKILVGKFGGGSFFNLHGARRVHKSD